jgi:hypothetical protein
VNRSTNRLWAATAGLAACGLILTGCGTGQIAQTANQSSAVNGTSGDIGEIALRNVHLQAVQTSDFLQPGTTVQLMFVVGNDSPDVDDKLVGVASEIGQVKLTGNNAIPARGSLIVGSPDGQDEVTPMGSTTAPTAEVTLSKPITNGLTYNFTFDFENAGRTSVAVPLSAGEAPRRQ